MSTKIKTLLGLRLQPRRHVSYVQHRRRAAGSKQLAKARIRKRRDRGTLGAHQVHSADPQGLSTTSSSGELHTRLSIHCNA